ncbi:MAG: CCA tRNA nucleotidyltransferase [Thermoplasmatales archaeon]
MTDIDALKIRIIESITESDEDRKLKVREIEKIRTKLELLARKENIDFEVFVGGSIAKGTDIKGSDADIFLLFKEPFDPGKILSLLRREFPDGVEEYTQHPYITVPVNNFKIDLVPGYKASSSKDLKTAVDRTPMHVEFVKRNFDEKMKNEARILKQFMKGIGVYGAESSVRGMSGYIAELLIYHFATFENVILESRKWRIPVRVGKSSEKFDGASMVVIDPVDPERNAAANVSIENVATFILASKCFAWDRWSDFLFPEVRRFSIPEEAVAISFGCGKCNPEVILPNLRRFSEILSRELEAAGFKILYSSVFLEKEGYVVVIPEASVLGESMLHEGPPVTNRNVLSFLERWGSGTKFGMPFIRGDRVMVLKERKVRDIREAMAEIIPKIKLSKDIRNKIIIISGDDLKKIPEVVRERVVTPSLGSWIPCGSGGNIESDDPEPNEG